jgi:hypothetical protein
MRRSTPLAVSLVLALAPSAGETLSFKTPVGERVTKTFSDELSLRLCERRFEGKISPLDMAAGEESELLRESVLTYTEHYREAGPNRPQVIARSFGPLSRKHRLSFSSGSFSFRDSSEASSELEGKTVVFAWSDCANAYDPRFEEGAGGDERLLASLQQDTDLRSWLPERTVSEGDTWAIEGPALHALLAPGGGLDFESEFTNLAAVAYPPSGLADTEWFNDNLTGRLRATFAGVREVNGTQLAVVKLQGELASRRETESEVGGSIHVEQRLAWDATLAGELRWVLSSGRLDGYQFEGDSSLRLTWKSVSAIDDRPISSEEELKFAGAIRFVCSTSKAQ